MTDILIRSQEGCDPEAFLLWDSLWSPADGEADWALAGPEETLNVGGLAARRALETAVILALFTDRRVPDEHPLAYLADGDPRGWWGDGVDVRSEDGEEPLGSLLWLLERAPLTLPGGTPIALWARQFALDALAPLLRKGAVVRIDCEVAVNALQSRLELAVQMYGHDAGKQYDRKFDLAWRQIQG